MGGLRRWPKRPAPQRQSDDGAPRKNPKPGNPRPPGKPRRQASALHRGATPWRTERRYRAHHPGHGKIAHLRKMERNCTIRRSGDDLHRGVKVAGHGAKEKEWYAQRDAVDETAEPPAPHTCKLCGKEIFPEHAELDCKYHSETTTCQR